MHADGLIHGFESIIDAPDETVWCDALYGHARRLGFDYCLYATLPNAAAPFPDVWVRSNYPEDWRQRYNEQGYAAIDPTVLHCMTQNLPLVWSPDIFATPVQRKLYAEACQHGIRAGVSLPAHGPGGRIGMLCLVRDTSPDREFWREVAGNLPVLSLLRDVIAQTAVQFVGQGQAGDNQILTPRELECLHWVAVGKTSKEIAALLHCAETTINFHLANVRRKLEVPSRQAAIAKAMQLGLMA
jgi:LuxR family quorum-sensing transcriptional regulator LasR